MNNQQHDRLVEWIIEAHRAGTLGSSAMSDLCARASKVVGFAVDVMDYIAARQDRACVVQLGRAVSGAVCPEFVDERVYNAARQRGGQAGTRKVREPKAPISTPEELEARLTLVRAVVEVACREHGTHLGQRASRTYSPVCLARDLIVQALQPLIPDETPHGLASLLAQAVGGSIASWRQQCTRRRNLQGDTARRIAAEHTPIRGRIVRPQGAAAKFSLQTTEVRS